MQVGIPVAYNVCEVKLDKINHWKISAQHIYHHGNIEVQRFGLSAYNIPICLFIMAMYSRLVQWFCTPDN